MSWIQTHSGLKFDFLSPRPENVMIEDIAHALSNLCRWTGHCRHFYSVAQHSVILAGMMPREQGLWGLLHDAAEAYIGDISSPLKRQLPIVRMIESNLKGAIWRAFGLVPPEPADVRAFDMVLLVTEAELLMGAPPEPWFPPGIEAARITIEPWPPHVAKAEFLSRFSQLGGST